MQTSTPGWVFGVLGFVIGAALGAAGGYYYASRALPATVPQQAEAPEASGADPYAEAAANPYADIKVNPFE